MARIRYESETPDGPMRKVIEAAQAKGEKEAVLWTAPVTETPVTKTRKSRKPVTKTLDVTKTPVTVKKGGRPKKPGGALSAAQRKAAQRARKREKP